MSLEGDMLIDRLRLKRQLTLWRLVALAAFCVALLIAGGARRSRLSGAAYVARVSVDGIITDDPAKVARIRALADDPAVSAVILSIDSPGGSAGGGEALHDALLDVAGRKPLVSVMRGEAASAGYMIAVAAPHIVARPSTLTGSIGVLLQTGEVSGLLSKLGVTSTMIVSGPLKGQPDLTASMTPAAHAYLQGLVDDLYEQFVQIVATGRHMNPATVRTLADGRAYTGRQALPLKLIDEFGGEPEARVWLAKVRHVPMTEHVEDAARAPAGWRARFGMNHDTSGLFGVVLDALLPQYITPRGPLALWLPGR